MSPESPELACGDCREHLHAYLDGELPEAEGAAVARHLESCADCFERSQLEEAFRHAIRGAAAAEPRPGLPGLQDRVARALDAEDERREQVAPAAGGAAPPRRAGAGLRAWSVRALVGAASVLIVAATWSTLTVPRVGGGEEAAVQHPAFVKGRLVCLDCMMMKSGVPSSGLDPHLPAATIPSPDPAKHHRLHLRCEEGRLWELFPEEPAAEALAEHDNAERPASIVGTAYPGIGVLRVARLELE